MSDLSNYINQVNDQINALASIREKVKLLNRERKSAVDDLARLRKVQTQDKKSVNIAELRKAAVRIVKDEARAALDQTEEFDIPQFSSGLFAAIDDPRTITFRVVAGVQQVHIDLDIAGGTLEDYASAISATRRWLAGQGKMTTESSGASPVSGLRWDNHFWYEKYYLPARKGTKVPKRKYGKDRTEGYKARYWATIEYRVSSFKGLAPFWRLLEYGNRGVTLESDKGGTPTPNYGPTHFVDKATNRINKLIPALSEAMQKDNTSTVSIQELEKAIQERIEYIDSMLAMIEGTKKDPTVIAFELETELRERLLNKYNIADPQKREQLIKDLMEGKEIQGNRRRLGKNIRVSTIELENIVKDFSK